MRDSRTSGSYSVTWQRTLSNIHELHVHWLKRVAVASRTAASYRTRLGQRSKSVTRSRILRENAAVTGVKNPGLPKTPSEALPLAMVSNRSLLLICCRQIILLAA